MVSDETDHDQFKHALGIHGDPVQGTKLIEKARRTGIRVDDPYGYDRAFKHSPTGEELDELLGKDRGQKTVLDVTAGGGAIPFEAARLGLTSIGNDLNPVASLIQKATIEYPIKFGPAVLQEFRSLSAEFRKRLESRLDGHIPQPNAPEEIDTTFLWARTISCPYCAGLVPLSPNWRLAPDGTGVRLRPELGTGPGDEKRICNFEVVSVADEQSSGTVAARDGLCPYEDCGRTISGDEIKRQAQAGEMGDQLFAIVYKKQTIVLTKSGKQRIKYVRGYRAPTAADLNMDIITERLEEKLPEWEATGVLPSESIWSNGRGSRVNDPSLYGTNKWSDFFSPRQLYGHCQAVDLFRSMFQSEDSAGGLSGSRRAAYVYLAIALDKILDYNSRVSAWYSGREVLEHTFRDHAFLIKWSYAEMALLVPGGGWDWAIDATGKSLKELITLTGAKDGSDLFHTGSAPSTGPVKIINGSGSHLAEIDDSSIDAVIMDPPYGANVMYAELSDYFYVWLKRTAGIVVPELFTRQLSDKNSEAVANQAHFSGQKGAARLADDDYRIKMEGIFAECRRVLKADGIMTVMFTHKDTGAWDALAMSLMDAGFVITASWPVNTEASGSMHIKDKASANSTIFLVCRPRAEQQDDTMYWEDVEPEVARAVRARVGEFQQGGIQGVDLYLASFGPALEAFSRHWPLTRGTPAPEPKKKRRTQGDMFEEFDPYAVRPEDALNAARREVKAWRLAQLASAKAQADMDGPTAFYVLAWDAFKAVSFPYDEALRLARAVGVDLEAQVIGRLAEKKAAEIKLWDSATRVAKGAIGPADGSRGMIDALHHAAHVMRTRGAEAAQEMLEQAGVAKEDEFKVAMEALLEVLPPSKTFSGIDADKAVKPAADDFDALEKLRRIAYEGEIGEPQQLELYRELMAAE